MHQRSKSVEPSATLRSQSQLRSWRFMERLRLYLRGWILNPSTYTKEEENIGTITLFIVPPPLLFNDPFRGLHSLPADFDDWARFRFLLSFSILPPTFMKQTLPVYIAFLVREEGNWNDKDISTFLIYNLNVKVRKIESWRKCVLGNVMITKLFYCTLLYLL